MKKHDLRLEFEKMCSEAGKIQSKYAEQMDKNLKKENEIILKAFEETSGDITKAAELLEHGIKALYMKLYERKMGPYSKNK